MFYGSRIPHFLEGKTAEEVRRKLLVVAAELNQKIELVNVYYNQGTGRTVAWYFHDLKQSTPPPTGEQSKKVTKKKAVKKVR